MNKITFNENPILFDYILSQVDEFFKPLISEFSIIEYSAELRFVMLDGKKILEQKVLVCGNINKPVKWHGFFCQKHEDWVWMFVPTVGE